MKNPLKCHGTLIKNESCGCLMESEFDVPVERSKFCTNPNHAPHIKPRYNKKEDMKRQEKMMLSGSARDCEAR